MKDLRTAHLHMSHGALFWGGVALGDRCKKFDIKLLITMPLFPVLSQPLSSYFSPSKVNIDKNLESTPEQKARYKALLDSQVKVDPNVVNKMKKACAKREQLLITYPKAPLMITL